MQLIRLDEVLVNMRLVTLIGLVKRQAAHSIPLSKRYVFFLGSSFLYDFHAFFLWIECH